MDDSYRAITGRRYDLSTLTPEQRSFLTGMFELFRQRPAWNEFSRAWIREGRKTVWTGRNIPVGSTAYRVCQDLESLKVRAEQFPVEDRAQLLAGRGLFDDDFDELWRRVEEGEKFDPVLADALRERRRERARLASKVAAAARADASRPEGKNA